MPGVSTQFSIQDKMTARLNVMIQTAERLNITLERTDEISESSGSGDAYDEITISINRASDAPLTK